MYFCNHIKIHVAFELVSYAPAHFFDPSVLRIIGGLVLPFAQSALEGGGWASLYLSLHQCAPIEATDVII